MEGRWEQGPLRRCHLSAASPPPVGPQHPPPPAPAVLPGPAPSCLLPVGGVGWWICCGQARPLNLGETRDLLAAFTNRVAFSSPTGPSRPPNPRSQERRGWYPNLVWPRPRHPVWLGPFAHTQISLGAPETQEQIRRLPFEVPVKRQGNYKSISALFKTYVCFLQCHLAAW